MNRVDFKLIFLVLFISISSLILLKNNDLKIAYVYYENNLILKLPLNKNKIYTVDGFNGEVVIEVKDNKVRIIEETSPLNICSKMGFIKESYESLICLPNKIIVTIESNKKIDTIIE